MMEIKNWVASFLTIKTFGLLIKKWFKSVIPFYEAKINVSNEAIDPSVVAQIFWRIYESGEIRFIKKYLERNKPVIELGSSIGAVSSIIGTIKDSGSSLYCFEANPSLITSIHNNLEINRVSGYTVFNGAIAPKGLNVINFHIGKTNLSSKISLDRGGIDVPAININDFIYERKISDYNLVCDIEGAEIFLLFEQREVFEKSSTIIIELHSCEYQNREYSVEQINEEILKIEGISLKDRYGHVFVYSTLQ